MDSCSTQTTANNDISVQFIHGKRESSDKMDCIIKLECNVCVESCRCPKTEDIDISDPFNDEKNVYERQYTNKVDSIVKCEADDCISDKKDDAKGEDNQWNLQHENSACDDINVDSDYLNLPQYQCHHCDYAAYQKGSLKRHIDCIHLNLKQHQCHLCDYATHIKGNLKRHLDSVHLKLKQVKCRFIRQFRTYSM